MCETEGSENRKETRIAGDGGSQSERGKEKRTAGSESRSRRKGDRRGGSDGDGEGGRDERHPSMAMQSEESARQTDTSSFRAREGREREGKRANFKL